MLGASKNKINKLTYDPELKIQSKSNLMLQKFDQSIRISGMIIPNTYTTPLTQSQATSNH